MIPVSNPAQRQTDAESDHGSQAGILKTTAIQLSHVGTGVRLSNTGSCPYPQAQHCVIINGLIANRREVVLRLRSFYLPPSSFYTQNITFTLSLYSAGTMVLTPVLYRLWRFAVVVST